MSRASSQYDIGRATNHCAASGEAIEPGEDYIATLIEKAEDEGFERRDYKVSAWEAGQRPERVFSFWKTRAAERGQKKPFLDDEILLNLFDRLADEESPKRVAFRFVLGLMLIRKKLLRFDHSERRGEQEIWLIRRRGVPAEHPAEELINPEMDEEAVAGVTEQLTEILSGDL
ncbi:MAG: hypothetical protein ACF8NJ_07205 [Phycisphaerales bacterium JB038]